MGKVPDGLKRNLQINLRVSEDEHKAILAMAKAYRMQVSEYLRLLLLQKRLVARKAKKK